MTQTTFMTLAIHIILIACVVCSVLGLYSISLDLKNKSINLGNNFVEANWENTKLLFIRHLLLKVSAVFIGLLFSYVCLQKLGYVSAL